MWCHLCKMKFTDQETFKVHIMKTHRPDSEFFEDSDSENSEENENIETFDDDDNDDSEMDEDMMDEQVVEENGNFSSHNNCSVNASQNHANTTVLNSERRTKKETDSKEKSDLKFFDSSEFIDNKILYIINPVTNQETKDSSWVKNQSVQQPMFMFNNVSDQLPLPNIRGGFEFNSRNVLIWLVKFKEMARALKFPMQHSVFEKIKTVHKGIFDNYNTATSSELTSSVMKVYEELDNMIHKHIASINEQL